MVPAQRYYPAAADRWELAVVRSPAEGCRIDTAAGMVLEGKRSGSELRTRLVSRRSWCRCLRIGDCWVRWGSRRQRWRVPGHRRCFAGGGRYLDQEGGLE